MKILLYQIIMILISTDTHEQDYENFLAITSMDDTLDWEASIPRKHNSPITIVPRKYVIRLRNCVFEQWSWNKLRIMVNKFIVIYLDLLF